MPCAALCSADAGQTGNDGSGSMTEGAITLISFVATLMVFSYALGDLPLVSSLYRTAVYVFIGMSAAFTMIVTYEGVVLPYLADIQDASTSWTALGNQADVTIFVTALLFGLLLLLKPVASLAWLTNSILAVVIVVSAATAVVGALGGTLFPLFHAITVVPNNITSDLAALTSTLLIFLGTMTGLFYFQFQARRSDEESSGPSRFGYAMRSLGKIFVVTTLGAIYATTMLSMLTIFVERMDFLMRFGV